MTGATNGLEFLKELISEETEECILWPRSTNNNGYAQLEVKRGVLPENLVSARVKSKRGRRVPLQGHRLAWELVNGPIPDGLWVLHTCDVRRCVNPKHLFLGTNRDNQNDRFRKKAKQIERKRLMGWAWLCPKCAARSLGAGPMDCWRCGTDMHNVTEEQWSALSLRGTSISLPSSTPKT